MRKIIFLLLFLVFISGCDLKKNLIDYSSNRYTKEVNQTSEEPEQYINKTATPVRVSVSLWDIDSFGKTKLQSEHLMEYYANKLNSYDIIFIQGIIDESAFNDLCRRLAKECKLSSNVGKNKEFYGIMYDKDIQLKGYFDFNPDQKNRWDKPPVKAIMNMNNYEIAFYLLKTDEDNAKYEIDSLQYVIGNETNIVILGNLHADCGYDSASSFSSYNWIINSDTTSDDRNCAFERIIINNHAKLLLKDSGVMNDVTQEQSENYLVYASFEG